MPSFRIRGTIDVATQTVEINSSADTIDDLIETIRSLKNKLGPANVRATAELEGSCADTRLVCKLSDKADGEHLEFWLSANQGSRHSINVDIGASAMVVNMTDHRCDFNSMTTRTPFHSPRDRQNALERLRKDPIAFCLGARFPAAQNLMAA